MPLLIMEPIRTLGVMCATEGERGENREEEIQEREERQREARAKSFLQVQRVHESSNTGARPAF